MILGGMALDLLNWMMNFNYSVNKSSLYQVKSHLYECNYDFIPILSSYIDIDSYSEKLTQKATRVEVFEGNRLIGLIAVYIIEEKSLCYISNVSIIAVFTGGGLATILFNKTLQLLRLYNVKYIQLQVDLSNINAIAFYQKMGFKSQITNENKLLMILYLT